MTKFKIGSLFDGSGGFPLAASMCGIEPTWASEVEPYPIAVTRSRFDGKTTTPLDALLAEKFPAMKRNVMLHLGDISKIDGGEIEPVDIITFGSPCQDLSVAGKRAGLKHEANGDEEITRSGLFMEAVRIIKEMREATNGRYPTFALWENVPGAFSSNKGEDFRTVLEELIKIVEPGAVMPAVPQKGWPYADSYCGEGWSLSYRTFDAQFWGVPQRRRRIHLVLDLRGERAGKVLFEREGLYGHLAESGEAWQATVGDAEGSIGADDREGNCCVIGVDGYNQCTTGNVSKSMTAASSDYHHVPLVMEPLGINGDMAGTLDANYYKGCGERQGVEMEVVFMPVKGLRLMDAYQHHGWRENGVCGTLTAGQNDTVRGDTPLVVSEAIPIHDQATRFSGKRGDKSDGKGNGLGVGEPGEPMNTLTGGDRHAVAYLASGKEAVGTLMANAGTKLWLGNQEAFSGDYHIIEERDPPAIRYIVRRLTPTEFARLQGFADRWGDIEWISEDVKGEVPSFWREVYMTDCTIKGKKPKPRIADMQSGWETAVIRWHNQLHTDSAEYKMWGNGIALPPALYCMQGMAEALEAEQ